MLAVFLFYLTFGPAQLFVGARGLGGPSLRLHEDISDWSLGELKAIRAQDAARVDSHARKPDCFRRVAAAVRVQCGELDMNEEERVKAAVAMTLCELATAKHAPPLECTTLRSAGDDTTEGVNVESCVEALSRSAQYWSSYSGYLREIPQLCHAFRQWNDIDIAREVYRNVSSEAIAMLRVMNESESRQHNLQSRIHDMEKHLSGIVHDMSNTQVELKQTSETLAAVVHDIKQQAMNTIREVLAGTTEHYEAEHQALLTHIMSHMKTVLDEHAVSLELLLPALQTALEARLSATYTDVQDRYREINTIALAAHTNWNAVFDQFASVETSLSGLTVVVSETVTILDAHVNQAASLQHTQAETAQSVRQVGETMSDLVNAARGEIEKINVTAAAIRSEWLADSQSGFAYLDWRFWNDWAKYGIIWFLQVMYKDSIDVERIMSSRSMHVAGFLWRIGVFTLRSGMTFLTSIALLAVSCKRWLSTPSECPRVMNRASHNGEWSASPDGSSGLDCPRNLQNQRSVRSARLSSLRSGTPLSSRQFSRIPDRLYTFTPDQQHI